MAINGSNVPGTKSLKDFTKSLASLSVPIMEGRTKGDMEALVTEGKAVTLRDYDFLTMDQKRNTAIASFACDIGTHRSKRCHDTFHRTSTDGVIPIKF